MKALLVRVGVDQSEGGGHWNAPCDLESGCFCYVPIPETKPCRPGLETPYSLVAEAVSRFGLSLPTHLVNRKMHLDPDFEHLTYGDRGAKGRQLSSALQHGDFLVFYAGLRDVRTNRLVYAIIGSLAVDRIVDARTRDPGDAQKNAHTRRILRPEADDIIVIGNPQASGQLEKCIPIGEYRSRAYRVTSSILREWGGISANDGYLQRSAVFPSMLDTQRFLAWWRQQEPRLSPSNNPGTD